MSEAPESPLVLHREVDCRGLLCPLPVGETEAALAAVGSGEIVRVRCTDPASKLDLAALCARSGDELLRTESIEGELLFWIRKR